MTASKPAWRRVQRLPKLSLVRSVPAREHASHHTTNNEIAATEIWIHVIVPHDVTYLVTVVLI